MGTVVNRALPALNEVSFEITTIFPLNVNVNNSDNS